MDFFGDLIEKVQRIGYAPLAPSEKSKSTYTLHNLIRDQLGMVERKEVQAKASDAKVNEVHITSDMADVAFWNYKELRAFLGKVHEILNREASKIVGKTTNAVAWSHDPKRTQSEIIDLLNQARSNHPQLDAPDSAVKRSMAKSMVQKRRVEAALANTFAVLAGNGSSYGDLFEECSELELSNEGLLDHLDNQIKKSNLDIQKIDDDSLIPRQLVIAYTHYKSNTSKEDINSPTVTQYLRFIKNSNNLAGNSEATLLARLAEGAATTEDINDD
jgi:hypothetical protein